MSFLEFLFEYYWYILAVLIVLIVGVIGFLVDSKNKEKTTDDSLPDANTTSSDNANNLQGNQTLVQDGQIPVGNAVAGQIQDTVVNDTIVPDLSYNMSQNTLEQVNVDTMNNDVNLESNVNSGIGEVQVEQQFEQKQEINNLSFQNINANDMVNDMTSVLNNQVVDNNNSVLESATQVGQSMQPVYTNDNISPVQNTQYGQVVQNTQMASNQSIVSNTSNGSINLSMGMNNNYTVNNVPINNTNMVNNIQSDMLSPLSIDNVNSMSSSNLTKGGPIGVDNGQVYVQNTSMYSANYNNVSPNNGFGNGMVSGQNWQQPVSNGGMINNTYQVGNVPNINVTGNNVSGLVGSTNNIPNGNIVVTSDGAKPFDVASMFANNKQ